MYGGYDPKRFTTNVEHVICSICRHVLKDPRVCRAGEHYFCSSCISIQLKSDPKCPECRDELSWETLKSPEQLLTRALSELPIKCSYINQGCQKILQLQNLEEHESVCNHCPEKSENSDVEKNSENEENGETSFCELGGKESTPKEEVNPIEEFKNDGEKMFNSSLKEIQDIQDSQSEKLKELSSSSLGVRATSYSLKRRQNKLRKDGKKMKKDVGDLKKFKKDIRYQDYKFRRRMNAIEHSNREIKRNQVTFQTEGIAKVKEEMRGEVEALVKEMEAKMKAEFEAKWKV